MMNKKHGHSQIYDTCKKHMHSYVLIETTDGAKYDGIITGLDNDNVFLAVPLDDIRSEERNPFGPFGGGQYGGGHHYGGNYGYGGFPYGGYGGFSGGGYPPRRFRRLVLPLAALTALTLLPWY